MDGAQFVTKIDFTLKRINKKRQALADYCGITVQSISDWARRGNYPQADIAYKIAHFLGVSLDWLLEDSYENQWDSFVDETTGRNKISPQEIVYRMDIILRDKHHNYSYKNDEEFYKDILDVFTLDEIDAMKSNHFDPSIKQLYRISKDQGIPLEWLLTGENESKIANPDMYTIGLAKKYGDLLKFYNSLAESDKKASLEMIVHQFHTKRKIRECLLEKGIDVKDVPELIQ